MHTMLLFTDCGNIYRQVEHTTACNCMRNGRVASERCEYAVGSVCVVEDAVARLQLPGHGELEVGPLPQGVREVRAVEIWRTSVLDGLSSARGVVVENVCGKLPAQDVSALVASGFAREINKCFGRRYCMYSLYGNVSFDRGSEWLQYRGVRCVERFRTFAARRGIDCTGMTVHLVILSGHIGQLVTVSMHGTLRQRLVQTGCYTHHSRIDDDSTNVNLAAVLGAEELQLFKSVHVVVTRRGCVMIRVAFGGKSVELTDDVMATTRARAERVMRDVVQQC
jgi:hypothetical protein